MLIKTEISFLHIISHVSHLATIISCELANDNATLANF